MNGYTWGDIKELQRIIFDHVPGGLLLSCGHYYYFGNPQDFKVGNSFPCTTCSLDNFTIRFMENREINVNLKWENN